MSKPSVADSRSIKRCQKGPKRYPNCERIGGHRGNTTHWFNILLSSELNAGCSGWRLFIKNVPGKYRKLDLNFSIFLKTVNFQSFFCKANLSSIKEKLFWPFCRARRVAPKNKSPKTQNPLHQVLEFFERDKISKKEAQTVIELGVISTTY